MNSCCSFILPLLFLKTFCIVCDSCDTLGQINGLNKFVAGQQDKILFFDTPSKAARHKKLWTNGYVFDNFVWTLLSSEISAQRSTQGKGLHYEVLTALQIKEIEKHHFIGTCFALFAEQVTQSFFVDVYELQRRFSYQLYYNSSIDIEKAAYEASNHTLIVIRELEFENNAYGSSYALPWHIRYHKPTMDKYVKLILPAPQIYITCTTGEYAKNLDYIRTSNITLAPCPDSSTLHCSQNEKKICSWVKVSEIKVNSLNFEWPIGLLSDKILVTVITFTIIIFGTVYILHALLRIPSNNFNSEKTH